MKISTLINKFDKSHPDGYYRKDWNYKDLINFANLFSNCSFLEVGVGNGKTIPFVTRITTNAIFGDYSRKSVEFVKKEYNVNAVVFDGCDLPYNDNHFDFYLSNFTLHNLPTKILREKFMSEAARVVRSGGTVLFGGVPNIHGWLTKPSTYLTKFGITSVLSDDPFFNLYTIDDFVKINNSNNLILSDVKPVSFKIKKSNNIFSFFSQKYNNLLSRLVTKNYSSRYINVKFTKK